MPSLLVLLPLEPATVQTEFSHVLATDTRDTGSLSAAPAALLPAATGAGAEVIAIVPAGALSWHQVELPRGTAAGSPRLRAVLEGLLEDRLLDEPDALHFAVQPQARAGAPVWVAVCGRAWLRGAVQVLEGARRTVSRIVPEFAPEGAIAWHVLGEADNALVVASSEEGVVTVPLSSAALGLLPTLPAEVDCLAEPAAAAQAEQVLQRRVALQQAPDRWLQAARSPWNLAQGEFTSSNRARTMKKLAGGWAGLLRAPQWRPVRWALVLLAVIHLAGLNAWAWKERAALESKRVAAELALTQTFPQVKTIVAPVVQMEKEVALLRQATGAASGADMESMLAALATAAPQQAITGLEFSGAGLRVRGLAAGPQQVAELAARLRSQGYSAQLQGDALVLAQEAAR